MGTGHAAYEGRSSTVRDRAWLKVPAEAQRKGIAAAVGGQSRVAGRWPRDTPRRRLAGGGLQTRPHEPPCSVAAVAAFGWLVRARARRGVRERALQVGAAPGRGAVRAGRQEPA
eukprot:5074322-Alexandrium_andersonii.AAC.1